MSLADIRTDAKYGAASNAKNLTVNKYSMNQLDVKTLNADTIDIKGDLLVEGKLTVEGTTDLQDDVTIEGNIVLHNSFPIVDIRNDAINSNRASILLSGRFPSNGPFKIQQSELGTAVLENFAVNAAASIDLRTALGNNINLVPNGLGRSNITNPTFIGPGTVANSIVILDATKNVVSTALTNGQLLIGSTGVDPVASSLTAGQNTTITPGAGSITIASGLTATTIGVLQLQFGGANVGINQAENSVSYGEFGNAKFFQANILLISKGISAGSATIIMPAALTAAAASPGSALQTFSFSYVEQLPTSPPTPNQEPFLYSGIWTPGANVINLYKSSLITGILTPLNNLDFRNNTRLYFSGFLFT